MASFAEMPTAARKHVVILSRTCLCLDSPGESDVTKWLGSLPPSKFVLYATSHQPLLESSLQFLQRGKELRDFIKQKWSEGEVVIIVGVVDEDLYVAASTKSFLIAAKWVTCAPKVIRYGIPAPTPAAMVGILGIILNQSGWYYQCTFDDPVPTKVVALCKSNTYGGSINPDEKVMSESILAILKYNAEIPMIKKALVCHLMAAIAHDSDFREVQDWAIAPSSSTQPNEVMEELKEDVRYMLNGRKPDPIFIRHTATAKSRFAPQDARKHPSYCQKHFSSIVISEKYRNKLKNRVVCVMDDYLNHGSTFEALRNLLVACEVKKIVFVAIGKFLTFGEVVYQKKSFTIEGDVHVAGQYKATYQSVENVTFGVDDNARRSLEDLKKLASVLQ